MTWNAKPTWKAGAALEAKRRVKIKAGTTTDPPEVEYAAADENEIGVTDYAVASGELVACTPVVPGTSMEIECIVGTAIARGTQLYRAASGMVSDTATSATKFGLSRQVGADNEHIEVVPELAPDRTTAAQVDSVAGTVGDLVTDFNALLAKLRTAGLVAP